AHRSVDALAAFAARGGERKVRIDLPIGGIGLDRETCVLGQNQLDRSVAVFHVDGAQRGRGRQVDRPIAVGDGDVAGDAVEADVAVAGGEDDGAERLVGGEVGAGADLGLAVETAELEVGAAGMEVDGSLDVLQVGGSEELAGDGDGAGNLGECDIRRVAFNRDARSHAVRGDGRASAVDVRRGRAGDGGEFNLAVVRGDRDWRLDRRNVNIAAVGIDT